MIEKTYWECYKCKKAVSGPGWPVKYNIMTHPKREDVKDDIDEEEYNKLVVFDTEIHEWCEACYKKQARTNEDTNKAIAKMEADKVAAQVRANKIGKPLSYSYIDPYTNTQMYDTVRPEDGGVQ